MKAMIFAAGVGERMRPLTDHTPKPLLRVGGRPLIEYHLEGLARAGGRDVVINVSHLGEQIMAACGDGSRWGLRIEYSVEETPLETAGGIRHALPLLGDGPVFTMNPDAIWSGPNPLRALAQAWDGEKMDALLMCVPPDQAIGRVGGGDFVMDADGRLSRGPGMIYGGAQILKTDLLATVPDRVFSLNVIWDQMLEQGRAYGLNHPGKWCDVGNPEGLKLAEAMVAQDV